MLARLRVHGRLQTSKTLSLGARRIASPCASDCFEEARASGAIHCTEVQKTPFPSRWLFICFLSHRQRCLHTRQDDTDPNRGQRRQGSLGNITSRQAELRGDTTTRQDKMATSVISQLDKENKGLMQDTATTHTEQQQIRE